MQGKTLQELAGEIERQANSKRDFIAPAKKLSLVFETPAEHARRSDDRTEKPTRPIPMLAMANGNGGYRFGMTDLAHNQLADGLSVPKTYYERMRADAADLLTQNANYWLSRSPAKHMIRTLDGQARAVLSDRYRPLDNLDLAEAVLPIIRDKQWMVRDCEITERRLYIKVVSQELKRTIIKGRRHGNDHVVHPGLVISNSEVGLGAFRATPSLHWPHCFNIAMVDEAGTSRAHVGKRDERFGDLASEFFRDETRKQDDKAFWLKVRDIVNATLTQELFDRMVAKFESAAEASIDSDPVEVVEMTARRYGFNESERVTVLQHLIRDGDLSLYGLSGAITRTAQDVDSYDRATELERVGGAIVELSRHDWHALQSTR